MNILSDTRTSEGAATYPPDNHEWEIMSRELLKDLENLTPEEVSIFEKMVENVFGKKLPIEQIKREIIESLEPLE